MEIFEAKTGKFLPLTHDQLARLTADQRGVYDKLVLAIDEQDAANAEAVEARANNKSAVQNFDAVQLKDSKRKKRTFLDEWKSSLRINPQPVPPPSEDRSDVMEAQNAVTESHRWLKTTAARVALARGAVSSCVRAWQNATGIVVTPEQMRREFIESENRLRAERVAKGETRMIGGRPGPSQIDKFAYATRGANGRRVGPGGAPLYNFRRGGQSQNAELGRRQAMANAAAAFRPKLPSER